MSQERFAHLCAASNAELESILLAAKAPAPQALAGFEWRGCNTPVYTTALGIRKFIKGFFLAGGKIEGYNIPVRQNGLCNPWMAKPNPEAPHRFGFYEVLQSPPRYANALLLDYGASHRNSSWRPERLLRDFLVQDTQDLDVMIGKAYLNLGAPIPVGFFILERLRPSAWRPPA